MTQKFGRNYRLTISPADGGKPIVISMPFTIEFWIQRNKIASLNTFGVEIYNLSQINRNRIFQDFWDYQQQNVNGVDLGWRSILLEAGYGANLKTIFSGNIFYASSARQGPDIVTRIEGRSGIFDVNTVKISETFAAGQTYKQLFLYLISKFPTLRAGYVGEWSTKFLKPVALNGPVWDIIQLYSGNKAYIDNDILNVLQDNEQKNLPTYQITDASGVLETPRRYQGSLTVTTLFEPGVDLDQAIDLNTSVEKVYNGKYNIIGISHEGIISAAVSGSLRTMLTLLRPEPFTYKAVAPT